ncbi:hypothetical protein N7468_001438 [Penicillium chermesinum]|uniref:Uncharacterized protein n=1 Tax=Penicillium chermesinum TaxID=63820 RepID=A0A9W9PGP0_9EURO|nr:uncharacterized protein N7468_001438 [Penicillium chermesinum]KAJ5246455.1 hypothetical protein N7468_001438 [Penicillium chermesinum]
MANSMDALGAFSHLRTNLPTWITRVSELAAHTAARHSEYSEAYRRHAAYKPKPRRHKSSSVCSVRTDDVVPLSQQKSPSPERHSLVESATKEDTPTQQAGRKRSSDEAPSIDSGDRYEYVSTRHNVIIDYDGHTQKELEEIARDIGLARNNIRRAKIALLGRGGFRTNILNKSANLSTRVESSPLPALSCVRSTRTGSALVGVTTGSANGMRQDSPFDFADKQLEVAHGLCETAACQVLRSGDCATELDGVEEKFKMLLDMVKNEVARLEEEKKQQEAKEAEEREKSQQQEGLAPVADEAPSKPPVGAAARLARLGTLTANKSSYASTAMSGAIEVDDGSSTSAESIDLSAIRSTRIRV